MLDIIFFNYEQIKENHVQLIGNIGDVPHDHEILKVQKGGPDFNWLPDEHYKTENGEKVQVRTGKYRCYLGEKPPRFVEKWCPKGAKRVGYCRKN